MASSIHYDTFNHAKQLASHHVYKTWLYDLSTTTLSTSFPPPTPKGLHCTSPTPLDLAYLFSKTSLSQLYYYAKSPFAVWIHHSSFGWHYCFYTASHAPTLLMSHFLHCLLSLYPSLSYEWGPPPSNQTLSFSEMTLLSTLTPLMPSTSNVFQALSPPYHCLILLTPLPYPELLALQSNLCSIQEMLFPFLEYSITDSDTQTHTDSDTCNHAHTSSQTQNNTLTDTTQKFNKNFNEATIRSIYYKLADPLATTITSTPSFYEISSNTTSQSHTDGNSQQLTCNQGSNQSKGYSNATTSKQSLRFFTNEVEHFLGDCNHVFDYYEQLKYLATYEVAFYFMSEAPLGSLISATDYGALINPTPSIEHPQLMTTFSKDSPFFEGITRFLSGAHHPLFEVESHPTPVAPVLPCCSQHFPLLFQPFDTKNP